MSGGVEVSPDEILNNSYRTVFPYVKTIIISYSTDDGSGFLPTWMDDFLHHMPKFTALASLELDSFGTSDFAAVDLAMSAIKQHIRRLKIYKTKYLTISALAAFVSRFPAVAILAFEEYLLGTNDPLVSPPPSITQLEIWGSGNFPATILRWFTDFHLGIIESFSPGYLPDSHLAEFGDFINRFGGHLSHITLIILGHDETV
ncbi:hypothetical protein K438DRAFT_1854853 [Mycena galopus ATCC 62051]|nr:hypothetical protein K438DRAFT_1854853 [Mycena galopus ATCC 62051]